jgi:K+-transporting ATPase ATPase A chain
MGNFYVDLWRSIVYVLLPLAVVVALLLMIGGMPMTLEGNATATGLEGAEQVIARGPVAAIVAIKQLGTNGGGFFGPNCTHPYENPNDWTNLICCLSIMLLPMAAVVMFGKMLNNLRHAVVIFGVMLLLFVTFIGWAVYWDSANPNPALTAQAEQSF